SAAKIQPHAPSAIRLAKGRSRSTSLSGQPHSPKTVARRSRRTRRRRYANEFRAEAALSRSLLEAALAEERVGDADVVLHFFEIDDSLAAAAHVLHFEAEGGGDLADVADVEDLESLERLVLVVEELEAAQAVLVVDPATQLAVGQLLRLRGKGQHPAL